MSQSPPPPQPWDDYTPPSPAGRRGMPWWGWLLIGFGVFVLAPCVTCVGWITYIGAVGPDTAVYAANQVPNRFIEIMREVDALEDDEQLEYFYSDAVTNIRNGFYFVSDRKVVIYSEFAGGEALTAVPFGEIADVQLTRNTSFFIDSEITLERADGRTLMFPVSSDHDRDERFYAAIRRGMEQTNAP